MGRWWQRPPRGGVPAQILVWALVAPWAIWAVARTCGLERGSIAVAAMAFTPYMALSSPLPVLAAAVVRAWAAAAVAVVAAVALAVAVVPRALGGPTDADGGAGPTLRVLAANMHLGDGNAQELVELANELDVDVLSVEELTPGLARHLDAAGLRELLPNRVVLTGEGSRGGGLYSRLELGPGQGTRLSGGFPLIPLPVHVDGAAPVEVVSVHTSPPTAESWDEDLAELPPTVEAPLRIMIGDFNATLDHDALRDVLDRGYDDAAATLGDGLTPTWPTDRHRLPALFAIDHVLADQRIGIRDFSAHDIAHTDHRAVYAELELPPG